MLPAVPGVIVMLLNVAGALPLLTTVMTCGESPLG